MLEKILQTYDQDEFLKIDGHNNAVIGVSQDMRLCYSKKIIVENLVNQGMKWEEAKEFYSFNIEGAHVGEKTPVLVDDDF